MQTRKTTLTIFFIALTVCVAACRKPAATNQTASSQTANTNAATSQEAPIGGSAMVGDRFYFSGTIGNNLRIEMSLLRDRDQLTGTYFYPRVGKNIDVKGSVDKDGNVDLRESDEAGKETGVFNGKWKVGTEDPSAGLNEIQGKWSRPDGSKETTFALTQQPVEFSASSVRLTPKTIKETSKEKHYTIEAEYPQIEGDARFEKFNREARALVIKDVGAFKAGEAERNTELAADLPDETQTSTLDLFYVIRYASDDLISVELSEGTYSRGAAHPNTATTVLNYDVKNGKKLTLADFFSPNAKYLNVISAYCIRQLKEEAKKNNEEMLTDETIQTGASPRADNYRAVALTKKGLWVTFDPYQVAPYAAGPQYVMVPYAALKDIIKSDGPIAPLAK
jgi:Protein of unknown function (DUF3298)